jgi:uncharacterized protein YydD (DUF2326 family)
LQNRIVVDGDTSGWPVQPRVERPSGERILSNDSWKDVLARLMFGLSDDEEPSRKYGPSFRCLFAYFARRQSSEAFVTPQQQSAKQLVWDQQVAVSFLLGLDWTIPRDWQRVREREKALQALKQAASQGVLGDVIGKAADLRTELTLAEDRCRQVRERVTAFRVLPEYHEIEREASGLTRRLNDLADANVLDRRFLEQLETNVRAETPPPVTDLERMYGEVGVALPGVTVRRFDEVRAFHDSVIANRKSYLQQETEETRRRIASRDEEKNQLDARRAAVMGVLQTHGALEHFSLLRSELSRLEAETETLRQRFRTAEQLESGRTELAVDRATLLTRLRRDFHEQGERLRSAILAFEDVSNALYEKPGVLTVSAEVNGPKFEVKIHAAKSKGVSNMQIFCFDMMLLRICAERGIGPGFLIHDSHLFDGVDERQVTNALEVGAETAERLGWQYIVTMNSDALPSAFRSHPGVASPRLTDATEDGGLFGTRFG